MDQKEGAFGKARKTGEIADTLRDLERLWVKQEIRDQKANPGLLSTLLARLNQLEAAEG